MSKKSLSTATKSGFTIIEFTLATAFISVLLITIAIITNNIISIYQKGLTLKAVNSVGRGLVEEFTETINASPSVDVISLCQSHVSADSGDTSNRERCQNDKAYNFIYQHRMTSHISENENDYTSSDGGKEVYNVQLGGAFCTGKYSYVWNTYYANPDAEKNKSTDQLALRYFASAQDANNNRPTTLGNFRLVRIEDPTYRVCSAITTKTYQSCFDPAVSSQLGACPAYTSENADGAHVIDITQLANGRANVIPAPEQGFLSSFDLDLQLYELAIFPISQDNVSLRTFMTGTFIIATERGNINLTRAGNYCDVNQRTNVDDTSSLLDVGAEFNYCAINKFNFAARTAGM